MMNIYVGTSGFGYREWKGKFYPENISPKGMLRFYAERFRTVEINNTFYHMPTEDTLASWAGQVSNDFIFAFKAPRVITHLKRLRNVESEMAYLFRTLSVLETKLGPVLFQFPKNFHVDPPLLARFLALIPAATLCAFEFRSKSPPDVEILDMLSDKGYSLCVADTDENPTSEISPPRHRGDTCVFAAPITRVPISRYGWTGYVRKNGKMSSSFSSTRKRAKDPRWPCVSASSFRILRPAADRSGL